jgi:hypothetical protein
MKSNIGRKLASPRNNWRSQSPLAIWDYLLFHWLSRLSTSIKGLRTRLYHTFLLAVFSIELGRRETGYCVTYTLAVGNNDMTRECWYARLERHKQEIVAKMYTYDVLGIALSHGREVSIAFLSLMVTTEIIGTTSQQCLVKNAISGITIEV